MVTGGTGATSGAMMPELHMIEGNCGATSMMATTVLRGTNEESCDMNIAM